MSDKQLYLLAGGITALIFAGIAAFGLYNDAQKKPFDASEWLPKAIELAKKAEPTAGMIEATATRITPDGQVQVGEYQAALTVRFRSTPSAADVSPSPPMLGSSYVQAEGGCTGGVVRVGVEGNSRGSSFHHEWTPKNQKCLPIITGLPRCTFKQIWQKAIAKGAPERAYADIDLALESGSGTSELRWRFEIVDRPMAAPEHVVFHAEFADDC